MLAKHEEHLEELLQLEAQYVASVKESALRKLREEHVRRLHIEAAPLLERVKKNLGFVRESLTKVAAIEAEARAHHGSVMTERFNKSSIDYYVPKLTFEEARGTWLLKR